MSNEADKLANKLVKPKKKKANKKSEGRLLNFTVVTASMAGADYSLYLLFDTLAKGNTLFMFGFGAVTMLVVALQVNALIEVFKK